MTTTSALTRSPVKTVTPKSKTTPKKQPVKTAQAAAKTPLKANVAMKTVVAKPVIATTARPTQTKSLSTTTKAPASTPASKTLKALKPKKVKLVRDSFTIPKSEYVVLDDLKLRAAELKHPVKKGELLRAGIKALAAMTATQFHAALQAVPTLKTGRPSN